MQYSTVQYSTIHAVCWNITRIFWYHCFFFTILRALELKNTTLNFTQKFSYVFWSIFLSIRLVFPTVLYTAYCYSLHCTSVHCTEESMQENNRKKSDKSEEKRVKSLKRFHKKELIIARGVFYIRPFFFHGGKHSLFITMDFFV